MDVSVKDIMVILAHPFLVMFRVALAMLAGIALYILAAQNELMKPMCSAIVEKHEYIAEQDARSYCENQAWFEKLNQTQPAKMKK